MLRIHDVNVLLDGPRLIAHELFVLLVAMFLVDIVPNQVCATAQMDFTANCVTSRSAGSSNASKEHLTLKIANVNALKGGVGSIVRMRSARLDAPSMVHVSRPENANARMVGKEFTVMHQFAHLTAAKEVFAQPLETADVLLDGAVLIVQAQFAQKIAVTTVFASFQEPANVDLNGLVLTATRQSASMIAQNMEFALMHSHATAMRDGRALTAQRQFVNMVAKMENASHQKNVNAIKALEDSLVLRDLHVHLVATDADTADRPLVFASVLLDGQLQIARIPSAHWDALNMDLVFDLEFAAAMKVGQERDARFLTAPSNAPTVFALSPQPLTTSDRDTPNAAAQLAGTETLVTRPFVKIASLATEIVSLQVIVNVSLVGKENPATFHDVTLSLVATRLMDVAFPQDNANVFLDGKEKTVQLQFAH